MGEISKRPYMHNRHQHIQTPLTHTDTNSCMDKGSDKDQYGSQAATGIGVGKGECDVASQVKMKMDVGFSFPIKVATTSSLSIIVYQ